MGFPQIGLESVFKDAGFNAAMKAYKTSVNDAKDLTDMTGKSMGESFASAIGAVGKFGAAVAGLTVAAGVAAFTALGAAAWKAGMDVDNAVDGIIIATGAVGPELDELTESYKRVLSATSSTAAEAGVAVGEISRRWQLTGDDLAELSVQFLDLARLMKVDVKTTITDVALAMEAFNVPAEDAVTVMEQVFVASQKSGVEMSTLLTTVKQYAAPMKALGFSFTTSVAMIAKWTSKGLDANKMVMALRLGIANMVDPTKDADAALEGMGEVSGELSEKFNDAVEAIKNAKDETEALNIGMSIFGKRGAVDLVTAIREGKLTAEEFTAAMDDSSGAIERTFQATKDWPELMQQVKNQVTVALEPIGTKFLDIAKIVLEKFMPVFQDVVVPFINDKVVPIFDALGKAMLLLIDGNFAGAIDALLPDSVIQRWKDFSPILGGLADIVKTALKGLMGANIWEDTAGFWDTGPMGTGTWINGTPGLKSKFIQLGHNMLDWIVEGLADFGEWMVIVSAQFVAWATDPTVLEGLTIAAKSIATDLIDYTVEALGGPANISTAGLGVSSTLATAVGNIADGLVAIGGAIAQGIVQGFVDRLRSQTVKDLVASALLSFFELKPIGELDWYKNQLGLPANQPVNTGASGILPGSPTESHPVPVEIINPPAAYTPSMHIMPDGSLKWYAKGILGAIFNSPTMIGVGDRGPEMVSVMPLRGSEPGRMSSPAGAMGGGGGDNYWVLNITTSAPTENILNDYRLLASMGGSA